MVTKRQPTSVFPLRFKDERTRDLLRAIATERNTSMNKLAAEMVERELQVLALGLESSLSRTINLLRTYRGEGRAEAWEAFAEAEALPEPITTRRVHHEDDPFGVARAFEVGA